MEQLIRKLVDEGFSVTLVRDPQSKDNLFIDMRKGLTRKYTSVPRKMLDDFPTAVEVAVMDLASKIRNTERYNR